jgi:hypothetical protein
MPVFRRVAEIKLPSGNEIYVESDIQSLTKILRHVSKSGLQRARTRATNKTLLKTRTQARRGLAKKFNLPAREVNPKLVSVNATKSKDTATLIGKGSRIPIYKTKGAKTQKKLGVAVNTGTGRRVIKHTFIATMPSGHVGIYKRTLGVPVRRFYYKDSQGRTQNRALPIRELMFPPMAHMLTNPRVAGPLFDFYTREYPGQLRIQLNSEWDKARGRG